MSRLPVILAAAGLLAQQAASQEVPRGWWVGAAAGASRGTQFCNTEAVSWSCSTRGSGLLGSIGIGRWISPQWVVGVELAPERVRVELDSRNTSSLTILSTGLTARVVPLTRTPLFLRVSAGASWFRLSEQNNGNTFVESGLGWSVGAVSGLEFHLTGNLHAGPFVRFDYRELGSAEIFFERLQRRVLSAGASISLHQPRRR